MGEKYVIERIGVDGDYKRYVALIKELDGKVDAIGMGGIGLYLSVKDRTYIIRSAIPLMKAARITPVSDGTALRDVLEPRAVFKVRGRNIVDFKGKKALITCAVDRYRLAEALVEAGCSVVCADLIFTLGIPVPIKSLRSLDRFARIFAPVVTKLPFGMLYPTGKREEKVENPGKHEKYYREADIIAGDFNYIKRYMPDSLHGKVIITNTVTEANIEELRIRGAAVLITTTPEFNGRSFGTNVMEAVVVAALAKRPENIKKEEYLELSEKLGFEPRVVRF